MPVSIHDIQSRGTTTRLGEIREISADDRTVALAFSSEEPVRQWYGDEVLSHDPGAVRTDRLSSGAAVLVQHDWNDQVGVVDSFEISADRRGRAVVRFGRGARAEEIFRDIVDGIRRHVSVGYWVHKIEVETRTGAPDLVRVTDWEPYEISIVPVPADPSVGVGRDCAGRATNLTEQEGTMPETVTQETAPATPAQPQDVQRQSFDEAAVRAASTKAERARAQSITELGAEYGAPKALVCQHIAAGSSPDAFGRVLLSEMNRTRGPALTEGGTQIGLTDAEVQQFSFLRLFRAMAQPTDRTVQAAAAFELDVVGTAAERAHRQPKGVFIPGEILTRAINTGVSGTNPGDTGGYTVATTLQSQSFVDMLRNRTTIMQMATPLGGLVGNVDIPKQTGGATGYWLGEDDEATLSAMEFGQFGLTPKTVAGMTEMTRRMLMQSSMDVEAMVRRDLAAALAQAIDLAAYYGAGTGNVPLGITNVTGINAIDFGGTGAGVGSGALPTYGELVDMESEVAADNADVDSMAYVMNARMRGHFKQTPKFAAGSDQGLIWEMGGTVNGYRAEVTNQIANGDVIFGNFADFLIGMWGGLDVTVDPYTHSARGRLRIVMMQDVDMAVRRPESFCYGTDATE